MMKKIIPELLAIRAMLITLSLFLVFHLLVIAGIIPYGIVWGSRLNSRAEMLNFEAISVCINVIILVIVLIRAALLRLPVPITALRVALFLIAALFLLNTIGNLLSGNLFERIAFTPVTLLLFVCSLRLAAVPESK